MNKNLKKNLPYYALIVLVLVGAGFGAYKLFHQNNQSPAVADSSGQNSSPSGQNGSGRFNGNRTGNRSNFKPVVGTIQSITGQTIVIQTTDNLSKNVICSSTTRFTKFDNGTRAQLTLADLKNGDQISVVSNDATITGSDINARMVMIGQFPTGGQRPSFNSGQQQGSQSPGTDSDSTQLN